MVMDWYHENGFDLLPGYLSPGNANTYDITEFLR
jgi:hypothetical protein